VISKVSIPQNDNTIYQKYGIQSTILISDFL
jgi:hypothetical protein